MKILLTGASGFLGSHLAKAFVNSGYEVHALIRKETKLSRLEGYENKLIFHSRESGLDKAFDKNNPYKAIVHTATCYGRNGEKDTEIFDVNLKYPLDLLENAVLFDTKVFFNTDTVLDKYLNSYSLSKKQFVEWGRNISERSSIRFCNIKLEHMYGPGDDDTKFTTNIINSCLNNVPVIKLTPGEQKRDFIYIKDVISAYQLLMECSELPSFEDFELGTGDMISIREFVETVHNITTSKSKLDFTAYPYRKNELMESKADIKKLAELGWKPKFKLIDALQETIQFG
ncbi:NAD-dependent epimerase/dehydratase family protein [Endozoicomonas atrinae]|uniref:NAD-dependent epimerase/dehydratase family protein n=1 Tax=Endozoicomonas atrinae TaxID=1333660 RepID=UPI000825BFCE|nr:NAD(P)-dependent oxidoreductase [Endozoicomonas atrinae]